MAVAGPSVISVAVVVVGAAAMQAAMSGARRCSVHERLSGTPSRSISHALGRERVDDWLSKVGVSLPAESVLGIVFGAGVIGALVVLTLGGSAPAMVVCGGVGLVVGVGAVASQRHRRDKLIAAALPSLVEEVARSVRSGASLHQAIADAQRCATGPVERELRQISEQMAGGLGLDAALAQWSARQPLPTVRVFCGALRLTLQAGSTDGRAFDGLAQSLRDKAAVEKEIVALVAQAKLSGAVVALLPLGFLAFSLAVDRGATTFLFSTSRGRVLLATALALDALGYLWMRHLASSVAS